jgi:thiol-disulfide isomerase/thioredoxin
MRSRGKTVLRLLILHSRNLYMKISGYYLFLLLMCCVCTSLFSGCTGVEEQNETSVQAVTVDSQAHADTTGSSWMTVPVTDAITGKKTSITELISQGRPVIIHTFAVWCPACSMQLRETAKLVQNNPGAYSVLGIDIDPRENTDMVKRHVEKNRFVGVYVAAPQDMTRSLIQTLGTQIVASLPQTMVVCNKSVTYIGDGVFPEAELKTILKKLC